MTKDIDDNDDQKYLIFISGYGSIDIYPIICIVHFLSL